MQTNIIWYRNDLRTLDHSCIFNAQKTNLPTIAVFYICEKQWQSHHLSKRKIQLIKNRLAGLKEELDLLNIPLYIFDIDTYKQSAEHLRDLCKKINCPDVFLNRDYELDELNRDQYFLSIINDNINVSIFDDNIFIHPDFIKTGKDSPFKVFTAFKNKIIPQLQTLPGCRAKPKALIKNSFSNKKITFIQCIELNSNTKTYEKDAIKKLRKFSKNNAEDYLAQRDIPSIDGTSKLSLDLSIGTISVKQALFRLMANFPSTLWQKETGENTWLNELIWREFYRHTVYHFPEICKGKSLKENYNNIKFSQDRKAFESWCNGTTGFPIVDAAMRQLNQTGWMHNRLRMISASFLIKDLQIDWRLGERYFMENLNDADFASNNGGWQWCASTGFDSAPYFRIFNPTTQGQRFDPKGEFVKKWIPELKDVPVKYIHEPHKLNGLFDENIDYPKPIVDHKQARLITLDMYKSAIG